MAEAPAAWAHVEPVGIRQILDSADFPWWICGGWALDLFLGHPIRSRGDIDIAILRRDQSRLFEVLAGWDMRVAEQGHGLRPMNTGEWLAPPLHGIWARPAAREPWTCEFLLNEASATHWIYRRDARITLPLEALHESMSGGFPILPPEIVLLYKSKEARPSDEADFRATWPSLTPQAHAWLHEALALVDPQNPWRQVLDPTIS